MRSLKILKTRKNIREVERTLTLAPELHFLNVTCDHTAGQAFSGCSLYSYSSQCFCYSLPGLSWVAFDSLELIAFLILFQIPYLKSF